MAGNTAIDASRNATLAGISGSGDLTISKDKFKISDVAVTATAAELNLLDTAVANSVVNNKAVIYGASGQVAAGSLAVAGNTDLVMQ